MPPNDELTTDYRRAGARSEAPIEQIKVARVPAIGHLPTTDLQALLHKRLRFLAFFLATGMAVIVLLALIPPGQPWSAIAVYSLVFAEFAVLEGVLWKKSSLCLRHLRLIELLVFGTLFAFWTLLHGGLY